MTDTTGGENQNRPPVTDRHLPPAEPEREGPLGSITGVDRAALGIDADPVEASPNAVVDASETRVPGPEYGDSPADARKPWETTLASKSDMAEIGGEPDPEGKV
jgi:hypothetical protein